MKLSVKVCHVTSEGTTTKEPLVSQELERRPTESTAPQLNATISGFRIGDAGSFF